MKLINLGSRAPQDVPHVRFRPGLVDHLLEAAAFVPVLATWIYILYCYRQSGGDIPSDLWASGGTALGLFVLLGACGYCPLRFINFPFRVGRHNVAYQYVLALRCIRVMNVVICLDLFFAALSACHAWANVGHAVCVLLLLAALAGYMALAWRGR